MRCSLFRSWCWALCAAQPSASGLFKRLLVIFVDLLCRVPALQESISSQSQHSYHGYPSTHLGHRHRLQMPSHTPARVLRYVELLYIYIMVVIAILNHASCRSPKLLAPQFAQLRTSEQDDPKQRRYNTMLHPVNHLNSYHLNLHSCVHLNKTIQSKEDTIQCRLWTWDIRALVMTAVLFQTASLQVPSYVHTSLSEILLSMSST